MKSFSGSELRKIQFCGVCRIRQSSYQIGALLLLLVASFLLCVGESASAGRSDDLRREAILFGVLPTLVASVISGLASTLCQWASQVGILLIFHTFVSLTCVDISPIVFFFVGEKEELIFNDSGNVGYWDCMPASQHVVVT